MRTHVDSATKGVRARNALLGLYAFLLVGCATSSNDAPQHEGHGPQNVDEAITPIDDRTSPLLDGIGNLHFPISTQVPLTQAYFNQGLTLAFGFNHAEAVRSFSEAARRDPTCGICYWGVALALGPNINAPMSADAVAPAWQAIQQARALRDTQTAAEQAYIDALTSRYSVDGADRAELDAAYAQAMAELVAMYPQDLHARTLYAEALMDLMPWQYWNDDGSASRPETLTLVSELEAVLAEDPEHAGAAHLYIHAMERFEPQKAEAAADRLGSLVPVAGHLVHMPSHIYLRLGRYADAVDANVKAAAADENYIAQCNAQGLYPAAYYPHNVDFLWYAAMMDGRRELSLATARKLANHIDPAMAVSFPAMQRHLLAPAFTHIRFGQWDEVLRLDAPAPEADLPFMAAMYHYTQGLALAALGRAEEATARLAQLREIMASDAFAEIVMMAPGVADSLASMAGLVVEARLAREQGSPSRELELLEQAVTIQQALPYTEPPMFHLPLRQVLGDALLNAGEPERAAAVFAEDLVQFPKNPWSLFGLEQSLAGVTGPEEDVRRARERAWSRSDVAPMVFR
ncbi:MAG: hypothetical protein NXH85_15985 [Pseudomonadaceae bacterium]|nr:hypothetical protein [Pseudomonadaceae bacterium]